MHVVSFAVGFLAAAALAAWKPPVFRRIVTAVGDAYMWARVKFIGDPEPAEKTTGTPDDGE